jgi:hypothetical protein
MTFRTTVLTAAVALLAFSGCGNDRTDNNPDAGCTNCTPDSGTPDSGTPDSGTPDSGTPDSGTPDGGQNSCADYTNPDGGTTPDKGSLDVATPATLRQVRYAKAQFGSHFAVSGVVVTDVSYSDANNTEFWVTDPNDPISGIWVHLRSSDTLSGATSIAVGQTMDIDGFFSSESKKDTHGFARRYVLANNYAGSTSPDNRPMTVTVTATGATLPPANTVDTGCFGDNQDGHAYMPQYAMPFGGTRVHVNGPVSITSAEPVAMTRLADDGGTLYVAGYNGFEVTGGILVDDFATYKADGGECDWAGAVKDGGTVTFPDGLDGVWDTYAFAIYGSADGYVPNSDSVYPDGGQNSYFWALYPQNCGDLPGQAQ